MVWKSDASSRNGHVLKLLYWENLSFRLRDRLVKIITDYRTETSLRHGCNDILKVIQPFIYFIVFITYMYLCLDIYCKSGTRPIVSTCWLNTTKRQSMGFTWATKRTKHDQKGRTTVLLRQLRNLRVWEPWRLSQKPGEAEGVACASILFLFKVSLS